MLGRDASMAENVSEKHLKFQDDDSGYFAWLAANRNGYVLNCRPNPKSDRVVMHRSDCRTIQGDSGQPMTTEYIKICSNSEDELYSWSLKQAGRFRETCSHCMP